MKKLLLSLILLPFFASAQNTNGTLQRQIASPNAVTGVFGAVRDSLYTRAETRAIVTTIGDLRFALRNFNNVDSGQIQRNPSGVYKAVLRIGTGTTTSTQTGVQVSMQLNDALLTETGHAFSDGTEFSVTGMSYNSYDARPSFSGSTTLRDHYTGFQFGPIGRDSAFFTDVSVLRAGSNFGKIKATNFNGFLMPQISGTFANKYVIYSADSTASINIGGKIMNRAGGLQIIGTSKFNTTSWPTSAISAATGRMLLGSDAFTIWNKATPAINNNAIINLGSRYGTDTLSHGGAVIRTNLLNTTTGESDLEIFTNNSASANVRALKIDQSQNVTVDNTLSVGGSTLNVSPNAGFQYNGSGGNFFVRTNGQEAYFTATGENYFGALNSANLNLMTNNTIRATISSSGSYTINALAGSGSRAVNADASGTLSASSDISLKQEDLTHKIEGLAEILQLKPRAYKWLKDIGIRGDRAVTELGFFANEVAPIIPSAAPMGNDGLYGFYDRAVLAATVKAIQEQQAIIEKLNQRITVLEQK